jgi:Trk-type K+ transport system membrane component
MTTKVFSRWAAWLLVLAITVFALAPNGHQPLSDASANLERFAAFAVIGGCLGLGCTKHPTSLFFWW